MPLPLSLWYQRAGWTWSLSSLQLALTHLVVLTLPHLEVSLSFPASNSILIRERSKYLVLDRTGDRGGSQGTYQHHLRELSSFNQMAPWQSYQLYRFSKPKRKWSWLGLTGATWRIIEIPEWKLGLLSTDFQWEFIWIFIRLWSRKRVAVW